MYLGPYLGLYFILITASSGGVYIYSCCSRCGGSYKGCYGSCYRGCCWAGGPGEVVRAAEAAIRVAGSVAIGTTSGAVVRIASGIGRAASGISGAYADGASIDRACTDGACGTG